MQSPGKGFGDAGCAAGSIRKDRKGSPCTCFELRQCELALQAHTGRHSLFKHAHVLAGGRAPQEPREKVGAQHLERCC